MEMGKRVSEGIQLELDEINAETEELIKKCEDEIRMREIKGVYGDFGGWRGRIRVKNLEAKIAILKRKRL